MDLRHRNRTDRSHIKRVLRQATEALSSAVIPIWLSSRTRRSRHSASIWWWEWQKMSRRRCVRRPGSTARERVLHATYTTANRAGMGSQSGPGRTIRFRSHAARFFASRRRLPAVGGGRGLSIRSCGVCEDSDGLSQSDADGNRPAKRQAGRVSTGRTVCSTIAFTPRSHDFGNLWVGSVMASLGQPTV
jgi:hypothetical protein